MEVILLRHNPETGKPDAVTVSELSLTEQIMLLWEIIDSHNPATMQIMDNIIHALKREIRNKIGTHELVRAHLKDRKITDMISLD